MGVASVLLPLQQLCVGLPAPLGLVVVALAARVVLSLQARVQRALEPVAGTHELPDGVLGVAAMQLRDDLARAGREG